MPAQERDHWATLQPPARQERVAPEKVRSGGSRNDRHNRLRDFHSKRHTELTGYAAPTEQHVPGWDRRLPNGTIEEAKLDVVTVGHSTRRHI